MRGEEFKLHICPALDNGVDLHDLQARLLQTAIPAGAPATSGAFRRVRDILGENIGTDEAGAPLSLVRSSSLGLRNHHLSNSVRRQAAALTPPPVARH
ncbi:hypothetical protein [Methylobacterium sp. 10]|uniref:hypothetical protein n=1 Tax=Methylobacterium sp. 10 TaxID=1101191 RepID=UPI0004AFD0C1|nr:hypothetical protein [Methylobacterium sp. 10]